jgi:hypothetical protein
VSSWEEVAGGDDDEDEAAAPCEGAVTVRSEASCAHAAIAMAAATMVSLRLRILIECT